MLDETAAAPTDPTPVRQEAPPEDAGPAVIVDTQDEGEAARLGRALGELAVRHLVAPRPMLRNLDEVLPEAVQGEGGPLALAGDPPQSTNTQAVMPPANPAPATAPAPKEPEVEVAKRLVLPVSKVRMFFNPDCPSKCQEGMIATATGGGRLCWCAIKRCRDVAQKMREQARAQARAQPTGPAQVNLRSLESLEKLTARVARLDAQIAETDGAAAADIERARAAVAMNEDNATQLTQAIRAAEEAMAALATIGAKLEKLRTEEAAMVGKMTACRRAVDVLEGKRDQRTAGMRREREKLQRRVNLRLAHQPAIAALEAAPGPAPATPGVIATVTVPPLPDAPWPTECSHGKPILPDVPTECQDCAAADLCRSPVAPSSSAPEPAGPPEEKTPVVELLANGVVPDELVPERSDGPVRCGAVVEVLGPAVAKVRLGVDPAETQQLTEEQGLPVRHPPIGEPAA